jgi:hypothetical protein
MGTPRGDHPGFGMVANSGMSLPGTGAQIPGTPRAMSGRSTPRGEQHPGMGYNINGVNGVVVVGAPSGETPQAHAAMGPEALSRAMYREVPSYGQDDAYHASEGYGAQQPMLQQFDVQQQAQQLPGSDYVANAVQYAGNEPKMLSPQVR